MDYIKLSRKMLEWEWYKNVNTKTLFIHMLLKANWKAGKFEGVIIPRGSFVSSISHLSKETNLTVDQVRTAISHLISTNEITKQTYPKFTVFTLVNWELYQNVPSTFPSESQASPKRVPTIEERKKERIKEKNIKKKNSFHQFQQNEYDFDELEKELGIK